MTTIGTVREFTGKHMLAIMLAFFASSSPSTSPWSISPATAGRASLVENSYVASQEFNEKTALMEADAALDVHPRWRWSRVS